MNKRALKWLFWLGWIAGGLYFADRSASYYRQARALPSSVWQTIPQMPPHRAEDRVLVFAPHPDDEALGCAGVIQQALQAGAQVWVVYMTNGDGFRLAVERQFRQSKPTPEQHIQFGEMRQREARHAMHLLGLADWRIIFLGYPDRALYTLWQSNWTPANALRSYYTETDTNPYRHSLRPGGAYCGQNVLRDVETVLRRTVPTHVYATHPADDHPDHTATALFVQTALAHLRARGLGFAQKVVLRYYLIHCGDWPQPQGWHPDGPLAPPSAFYDTGLHWQRFDLTPQWQAMKRQAILSHHSQMLMMGRFLQSFVRQNELFVEQCGAWQVPDTQGLAWKEPEEEDFLRELQPSGDFSSGVLRIAERRVVLRLNTRGKPRAGYTYTATLHTLLPSGEAAIFTLRARSGKNTANTQIDAQGVTFVFPRVPKGSLVTLHAQSRFAGLPVDKTFAHVIRVP